MTLRIFSLFILASALITVSSFIKEGPQVVGSKKVISTVIIDPGHGGTDFGARGKFSNEKDICLGVSMKLGEIINKEFPSLQIGRAHV